MVNILTPFLSPERRKLLLLPVCFPINEAHSKKVATLKGKEFAP